MTTFERNQMLFDIIMRWNMHMQTPDPPQEEPGEHEPDEEHVPEPEEEEPGTAAAWRV
jgi:hypothetical protein